MDQKPSTSKENDEDKEDEETEEFSHLTDFTILAGDVTPHLTAKHQSLVHGSVSKEAAIATHTALIFALSPDKEQQIREFYDRLDIDHDGTIDIRDLTQALKHETPHIPSNLAPVIMSQMSGDNDGKVGFVEFANYVLDHEQKLTEMFAAMDRNNDGVIDVWELRHYCMDNGMSLDKQQAQTIVNKMDQSGNGTFIGVNEFVNYMILYPSNDIKEIVDFWRHAMIFDIGEDVLVPEDFSAEEIKEGIWWRHLVAGGVAGAISRSCTAPFDRLKVYLQVNSSKSNNLGLLSCMKLLHAEGGLKSFWRGNGINVIKIAPESAIKFMCYEEIKRIIQRNKSNPDDDITLLERLLAGSSAGAISQSLIYPMEVLKTRLALRRTGQMDRGIIHFAHKMYTKEGVRSFYKGYIPNLIGIIPYAGIDLAIYETLKRMYLKSHDTSDPGVFALLACGTCSSTCGQLASYPFSLVRTRLQARTVSRQEIEADTMFGQFRYIYKNEGFFGFYRGIAPNFMKGLLEYLMGVRVRVSGDEIEYGRPALIVMNHRTRLDWMYMWCALYQVNPWLITSNKISLKAQLKNLPGAGFGMAAAQFVFLERNAEVDRKSFDDAIDYFHGLDRNYQILLFPEGTDKSEWTTLKSREFAKKNGLKNLEYVLYPRTTGFLHLLNRMREKDYVDYIYDITLAYPYNIVQSEIDLVLKGASPREVHFHVKKIPIGHVPLNDADVTKWLNDRWLVKEQMLHNFYSEEQPINRQFPVERGDGVWRSWKESKLHIFVKVTALMFWYTVISACIYHVWFVRSLQIGFTYFFVASFILNCCYGGIDKFIIGNWQKSQRI